MDPVRLLKEFCLKKPTLDLFQRRFASKCSVSGCTPLPGPLTRQSSRTGLLPLPQFWAVAAAVCATHGLARQLAPARGGGPGYRAYGAARGPERADAPRLRSSSGHVPVQIGTVHGFVLEIGEPPK